jgi:hypothetical protein
MNMNEKTLITEINRINKLMGNELLIESLGRTVVNILTNMVNKSSDIRRILPLNSPGLSAFRRLESTLNNWRSAGTGGQISLSTVIDDLYIVSQSIPEVRIAVTDFILSQDRALKRAFDNFLKDRKRLENLGNLPDDQLEPALEQFVRAWFGNQPVTNSQIEIITDRLLFDVRRNLNLPPPGGLDVIVRNLPFKNVRYLLSQLSGIFATEKGLKRKFVNASERANEHLLNNQPGKARKEVEYMMSVLASAKKWREEGWETVYDKWKAEMLSNPQYKMTQADFVEFDKYKNSGRGLELFDELTKKDPSWTELTWEPWKKLWPFKRPSTPGGFLILSDKMLTKDWWQRFGMFILTKNARTIDEYIKYLSRVGVTRGTIEILVWRFLMLRIMIPLLYTIGEAIPSGTETLINEFLDSLERFGVDTEVDFADNPEEDFPARLLTNMLNTMYGVYYNWNLGDFANQQTLSNEVVDIADCFIQVLRFGGGAPCLTGIFNNTKRKIEEMDIPQEVKDVTTGKKKIPSVGETENPIDKKSKKKIIPVGE